VRNVWIVNARNKIEIPKRVRDDKELGNAIDVMLNLFQHLAGSLEIVYTI
jgi:hypothetical protein